LTDLDRLPDLPWPPAACDELSLNPLGAAELPPELGAGQAWIRCGDRRTPLNEVFAQSRPRYRSDCPPRHDGRFQVWYGARTTLGALCEVFGDPDRRFLTLPERQRKLIGSVRWTRDLRLLDLRAPTRHLDRSEKVARARRGAGIVSRLSPHQGVVGRVSHVP
jgi:hypothetical protein